MKRKEYHLVGVVAQNTAKESEKKGGSKGDGENEIGRRKGDDDCWESEELAFEAFR